MHANARDTNWPDGVIELRFVSDGPMILLADRRVKKDVIPTGTHVYRAMNPETKKMERRELVVPESRIDHWVEAGNAMLSAGVEIPMPLDHNMDDSEKNRGFVTRFFKERKADGRAWLWCEGEMPEDVPGGGFIGKTIKAVSAGIAKAVEKAGKIWEDVPGHISPCINAVITGQSNFVTLKDADTFSEGGDDMTQQELEAKVAELQGQLDAEKGETTRLKADLVLSTGQVVELKSKYEPPAHVESHEEVRLKADLKAKDAELATLKDKDVDAEVQALLKDQKIVAADAPKWAALLRGPKAETGMVCLKETKADKSVCETEAPVAETVRTLLKNMPKGAALAGQKPGGKPLDFAAEGDVELRDKQAKRAREISAEKKIPLGEAQILAETELRA